MELKQLLKSERAVSPVIGVILMVAITVILAAVIGTFVLGLGDQVSNTSPSASFTFDFDSSASVSQGTDLADSSDASERGELTITHDGGDSIQRSQLSITDGSNTIEGSATSYNTELSAGSTDTFGADSTDTVRVVWQSSNGGDTATLGKWSGPDA